jgi:oligopeptide/dipeptide ABC transporter ATP-binding protein
VPIPSPQVDRQRKRILLTGDVPSPVNPPRGCHFHPRCHLATAACRDQEPELKDVGGEHWVACHR